MSVTGLINWFVPSGEGISANERRRSRKLAALLLSLSAALMPALIFQAVKGMPHTFIGTGLVIAGSLAGAFAVRARISLSAVAPFVLTIDLGVAAVLGMKSEYDGVLAVFWMSIAPLIALAVGGRRAGLITLGLTIVAEAVSLVGIELRWLTPVVGVDHSATNQIFSLAAATVVAFSLMRTYEVETAGTIEALESQNDALAMARAQAESGSRAKSDFLATISHEIRTPLNGVTGMAQALRDERDPKRVEEGLRVIHQSADMLLAVINDVLDFSKIEANKLELESAPLNPHEELKLVVELIQTRAAERGNELELKVAPEVPEWMLGDATRLRQVAMNLVSNAAKFTKDGRVSVRLLYEKEQLVMLVRDTGIGISPSSIQRLFQPFTQADHSTTRRFGGTGLGLVITQRLVLAMGGTITVESEEGFGARFEVRLPVTKVQAPLRKSAQMVVQRKRSVLLVEDNFVNQLVAQRLLEKLGHQVTVANDGAQALERLASESYDLVLMDCHMPVMDGFEATLKLRERGYAGRVVALTAAVTVEDRTRCMTAGMNGVLSKPLRLEELQSELEEMPGPAGVTVVPD